MFVYDNNHPTNRLIVLASPLALQMLSKSHHWASDGTFSSSPNLFSQMTTIHAVLPGPDNTYYVIPTVYAAMTNKSTETYTELLTALNNLNYTFQPQSVMTDFEHQLQNSFVDVFPGVTRAGCLFHFKQAVLRSVNELGLKREYEEKVIVNGRPGMSRSKKQIKRAMNIAFVHPADVPRA